MSTNKHENKSENKPETNTYISEIKFLDSEIECMHIELCAAICAREWDTVHLITDRIQIVKAARQEIKNMMVEQAR
jgi:hypothetical protein